MLVISYPKNFGILSLHSLIITKDRTIPSSYLNFSKVFILSLNKRILLRISFRALKFPLYLL